MDVRAPDMAILPVYGTLYESPGILEDHGGWYADDFHVNLMAVSGNRLPAAGTALSQVVFNQQIAVTLLQALGLPLAHLDGYRAEETSVLPGVFR
ncbi:hypothetical protein BD324DRAFT_624460 [Kockovaella imperatae]|uniref:Uncharacterized protein n=1 Tax=Kockovaella imperatae TaxID=4999 RepID=A0A1Y1UG55_9TREE|nr:hypothetical protein BD324DRAFT_624460 [Kockovaella imperatae]ORX37008.1 hypothetical protein BD324DRAFT_624460 [Kockovaella imperatae]